MNSSTTVTSIIKEKTNQLINKIEENRSACDMTSCLPTVKTFDYKRHTINLIKTTELLQSPRNEKTRNAYKVIIEKNPSVAADRVKYAMLSLLGAFMIVLGAITTPLLFPLGISCMAGGSALLLSSVSLFAKTVPPNTATCMSAVCIASRAHIK